MTQPQDCDVQQTVSHSSVIPHSLLQPESCDPSMHPSLERRRVPKRKREITNFRFLRIELKSKLKQKRISGSGHNIRNHLCLFNISIFTRNFPIPRHPSPRLLKQAAHWDGSTPLYTHPPSCQTSCTLQALHQFQFHARQRMKVSLGQR